MLSRHSPTHNVVVARSWCFPTAAAGLVLCAIGCTPSVQLQATAAKVQVGNAQPEGCKRIADIVAAGTGQGIENGVIAARNDMRNKTSAAGGNYAVITTSNSGRALAPGWAIEVVLTGAAYDCPNLPPPPVETITPRDAGAPAAAQQAGAP